MSTTQLFLASSSPRRRELLHQIQIPFAALSVAVEEIPLPGERAPDMVRRLALIKARAGWRQVAGDRPLPVLGADTAVAVDEHILGKPADATQAMAMLRSLSGRRHEVYSAVALVRGERELVAVNRSEVWFRALADSEIRNYCRSGEPLDKAGGYGIQGLAAVFIERLHGSYSGVMGLPLQETASLLEQMSVEFWLTANDKH